MAHEIRVTWSNRQMYSPSKPIRREQIFQAFTAVLAAATGFEPNSPEKIAEQEVAGVEFLGYWAAKLTFRIAAGEAALICSIDPVLASMGVSGEDHSWRSEGLADGLSIAGSAFSSGRQPSWALLVIDGDDGARAAELGRTFVAAFPPIMSAEELDEELGSS